MISKSSKKFYVIEEAFKDTENTKDTVQKE